MKRFVLFCARLSVVFILFLTPNIIQAKEPLVIVTDPWPPFSMAENKNIIGMDVEIIKEVFSQLKIPTTVKSYPWKRCLVMVENKQADSILDVSVTVERKTFLFFPDEPVSEGITVFFIRKGNAIPFRDLQDLNGLRAGAILGYSYCDEIDKAPFMVKAMRVATLEQNFKKLLSDRIDFLVEVDAVGYYTASAMGISDQISIIPNANYCRGGNFLAFAKKPGHKRLATKFGKALRNFKSTKKYLQIQQKFGLNKP